MRRMTIGGTKSGTSFNRTPTRRMGSEKLGPSSPVNSSGLSPTNARAPNLMTAQRSKHRRISMASNGSSNGLLSDVNSNDVMVVRTEDVFKNPIDYSAQKGNACDERLAELIKQYNIRMPVKMIEPGKYMIGTRIVTANLQMNTVMVRVGGGFREFYEYIKCEETELRRLQIKME